MSELYVRSVLSAAEKHGARLFMGDTNTRSQTRYHGELKLATSASGEPYGRIIILKPSPADATFRFGQLHKMPPSRGMDSRRLYIDAHELFKPGTGTLQSDHVAIYVDTAPTPANARDTSANPGSTASGLKRRLGEPERKRTLFEEFEGIEAEACGRKRKHSASGDPKGKKPAKLARRNSDEGEAPS